MIQNHRLSRVMISEVNGDFSQRKENRAQQTFAKQLLIIMSQTAPNRSDSKVEK